MSITLTPELEKRIEEKVKSGAYRSSDEALSEAVQLLDERDRKLESLRADIAAGEASGEPIDGDIVFSELRKELAQQSH